MDRNDASRSTHRVPTGVEGFDSLADGGLPKGATTLVLGGAGAGKTVFGLQVLAKGARDHGEPGVLVTFEERAEDIVRNSGGFTWGGAALAENGVHIVDARLPQSVEPGGNFDLVGLLAAVGAKAESTGARRVVFDGIDVLLAHLSEPSLIRREIFRLREWVADSGLSAILTAKADPSGARAEGDYDFMSFIADCVVALHVRVQQGTALRHLRIVKYRGASHSGNEFPVSFSRAGMAVAAHGLGALQHPASTERVSTGVERLDAMLAGGYYRGSSVLITGAPGTAKTSLSAAFAQAAAARGERTLYVSFDESPDQIVRNVASIGIQLLPHRESEVLWMRSLRGRGLNPEAQVSHLRALIADIQPRNLVIDPISALGQRGCEPEAEAAAQAIIDLSKGAGITVVNTSLLGNSAPFGEQTPLNISTIADTWMHVSYAIQAGERNRALTIIKSRGAGHSNQVRELVLSDEGVSLADVYAAGGEVLMGTLRWEKEHQARREKQLADNEAKLRERRAALALAETGSQIERLRHALEIQQAELEQLRNAAEAEAESRSREQERRLRLRRADPGTQGPARSKTGAADE